MARPSKDDYTPKTGEVYLDIPGRLAVVGSSPKLRRYDKRFYVSYNIVHSEYRNEIGKSFLNPLHFGEIPLIV
jgi:hypothetical protein